MMSYIPTESEIRLALSRDPCHGQQPQRIVVPDGYHGPTVIDGIPVEMHDVDEPYIMPARGGRLAFDGSELTPERATEWLARALRGQVFTSMPGSDKCE